MFRLSSDKMTFFTLVEMGYSLETHVVRLCGARGENYTPCVGTDEVSDVGSGGFDGFFGFPAIGMGSGMWVAVKGGEVRDHFIENARVCWGSGLGVKVYWSSPLTENNGLVY